MIQPVEMKHHYHAAHCQQDAWTYYGIQLHNSTK